LRFCVGLNMSSEAGCPLLNLLEDMALPSAAQQGPRQGDAIAALEAERDLLFLELESMSLQPSSPQPLPPPHAALLDFDTDDHDEQPSVPLSLPPAPPRPQPQPSAEAAVTPPQPQPQPQPQQPSQSGGGGAMALLTAGAGGEHPSLMESSVAIASKTLMGRHRVTIAPGDRALLFLLRPDVSHDDVVALTEQVLLTHAGVVRRVESDKLEVESARCFVYVGVSGDRLHGVLLHVLASPGAEARADALEAVLGAALHSELFTLGHLKCATGSGGGLHPTYVESLQTAMEMEMLEFVAGQAEILEESVTQAEKKCARLMTLLKPAYTKAGQAMPSLTRRPPQPDPQPQQQPHGGGGEEAKKLLLRARRKISSSSATDTYFDKTVAELDSVLSLLEATFETQAAAKLEQREQACAARKSAIEAYRLLVVSTLFSCKQLVSENLRQLARVDDAVVFEGPCLFEGKRGQLALTPRHIVFHSPGLLLIISPTVRVIPIATISALGVLLITPDGAAPGPAEVVVGGEILKITIAGGAQIEFSMPDATPGHTRRVADLVGCLRTLISKEPTSDNSTLSAPAPAPAPAPAAPAPAPQPSSKKVDKIAERLEALRRAGQK